MTFVQATTGGGGWPMSVWLTPDLKTVRWGNIFSAGRPIRPARFYEGIGTNRGGVEAKA